MIRIDLGQEHYVVEEGQVYPEDEHDEVQRVRAEMLSVAAPHWVEQARRDGALDAYDPDRDCTLARVIAERLKGTFACDPQPTHPSGTQF